MSTELHTDNLKLIRRIQAEAADEIKAVTDLNIKGELLVGDGTKANHLDPSSGIDNNVLVLDSTQPLGVKWGSVPSAFDQDLNTTDNATFNNLTVNGTQTIINSVTITIDDPLQKWGNNNTADVLDSGWYACYNDGIDRFCGLYRKRGTNIFKLYTNLTVDPATGTDNQIEDGDASFQYAEIEVAQLNMIAANGNFNIIAPNAATTAWTLTLPDDKPAVAGNSLVAVGTTGAVDWENRVSQVTNGAGMNQTVPNFSTTGTLSIDHTTLPAHSLPVIGADTFAVYDSAGTTQSKATLSQIEPSINHDNLAGFVANEHIDHSTVSLLTTGPHLEVSGDATIASNITLIHSDTAVTPGSYNFATLTVDQRGHLTAASTGAPVTSVAYPALSGLTQQTITTTGSVSVDIANTSANTAPGATNLLLSETAAGALEKTTVAQMNAVLDHDTLSGYVANEHIDHSSVSLTAAAGSSGLTIGGGTTGDLTASRALAFDANNLPAHAGPLSIASDKFVVYDATTSASSTITKANLELSINHNNLVNGGGNQHVDHSTVSVIGSNSGLAVATNNLTSNIGLVQDINTLAAIGENVTTSDLIPIYNTSGTTSNKATIAEFEVALNHDNLLGFVSNEHIDHSAVSITTTITSGLDVGGTTSGDLTVSRALRLRPELLTVSNTLDKTLDTIIFYDDSASNPRKTAISVLEAALDHDLLTNFVANEHVDHSSVSISTAANSGLIGGGDITSTRTLSVDINGTTGLGSSPAAGDEMLIQLAGGGALRQIDMLELNGAMNLSALADYDANDHIDHTAVLVQAVADSGLTIDTANSAVDMTAGTKQLAIDISGTTQMTPTLLDPLADELLMKDADGAGSGLRSILTQNIAGAQLNLGSAAANVTVASTDNLGSSFNKTTRLNLAAGYTIPIAGAAAEGVGRALYTFPQSGNSAIVINSIVANVTLTGTGTVNADTPEIGVGTVIATGAVATLASTFDDVLPGDPAVLSCNGTNPIYKVGAPNLTSTTASAITVYLNVADTWAGADTLTASGSITVNWTYMPQ